MPKRPRPIRSLSQSGSRNNRLGRSILWVVSLGGNGPPSD